MKITIFKDVRGLWRFRILAGNNKIIAQSEGYKTRQSVVKTAKLFNLPTSSL